MTADLSSTQLKNNKALTQSSGTPSRILVQRQGEDPPSQKSRSSPSDSPVMVETPRRANGIDLPYESTLRALQVYHSIHGNLAIPRRYAVPRDTAYPSEWHGVDLAGTVYNMKWWQRHVKQKPDRVTELNQLGFVWERLQPEWNLVLEALIVYSSKYGDLLVPSNYIVPHGDPTWPEATWGIPLGNRVYRIRQRDDFLRGNNACSRRKQLDGLGFIWDVNEYLFRKFYVALRHYAVLECQKLGNDKRMDGGWSGSLRIPSTFVIPENQDWPKKLWNYPLGVKCTAVRQKGLYVKGDKKRQQLLSELGFQWGGNASLGWLKVVHAAAIYSKLNGRTLDVPFKFVVPAPPAVPTSGGVSSRDITGEWPWPEHLWGLPLGQRLKDIRVKGAYLSGSAGEVRRKQLDALGFIWKPKRGRRRK